MIVFGFILGVIIGFPIGIYTILIIQDRTIKKAQKVIEHAFSDILSNYVKLKFQKRINKFVYLQYNNWEVIYQLDSRTISIFEEERCIYTSTQLSDSKISDEISKYIEDNFEEINDIVVVNNNIYSVNMLRDQFYTDDTTNNQPYYTIDSVLDRINEVGYGNLTQEEKEFLKNNSK